MAEENEKQVNIANIPKPEKELTDDEAKSVTGGNRVQGNFIGTNAAGLTGNTVGGSLGSATGNTVGGTLAGDISYPTKP